MRHLFWILVFLCLPLTACVEQTLNQTVDNFTPNLSGLNPKTSDLHGIVMKVKGCWITPDRKAICQFTALSKYRDRKLKLMGGHYVKIQDDTGISYNTLAAFGPDATVPHQGSTTLVADTSYDFTIMASNLSTQATKVRAITITRMDVTGAEGYRKIETNFSHPPMLNNVNASQITTAPAIAKVNSSAPTQKTAYSDEMPYRYLFATIKAVSKEFPDNPNLAKGTYFYLREDGVLGFNFSKPGPYGYAPNQRWKMSDNELVIIFDQISYTFNLTEKTNPIVTYLDQGGAYKMVAYPKAKGQR